MRSKPIDVIILDVALPGERRLVDTIAAAGLDRCVVATLDELIEALRGRRAPVVLLAFEALWPEPQAKLRRIREASPAARLLVAHSEGSPRLRFGQRLWAAGLADFFFSRSTPAMELEPILLQAAADSILDDSERVEPTLPSDAIFELLQSATRLAGSLVNQTTAEGLFRELQRRLPQQLDHVLLELLVGDPDEGDHHLFTSQTEVVEPESFLQLTEELCAASSAYTERPISPGDLRWVGNPPVNGAAHQRDSGLARFTEVVPMVHCGRLVGCLGVAARQPISPEARSVLQLVALHLTTAVRAVRVVKAAEAASLVDELTGAYNRRYLRRVMVAEWQRARRYNLQLAVAMIDVDHFKQFNDSYGHASGDHVLRVVIELIAQHLRETDHIVRYGGEEFVLLLPETGITEAALVVERLRMLASRRPVYFDETAGPIHIAFSAGVAAIPDCEATSGEELLRQADHALLVAKRTGRNRVCVATTGSSPFSAAELTSSERRRFPRLPSNLRVQYVPLPDFEPKTMTLMTQDQTPDGVGVVVTDSVLKPSSYALVCLEHSEAPRLSKVMWTRRASTGLTHAGIRFLQGDDLPFDLDKNKNRPRALVAVSSIESSTTVQRVLFASGYEGHFIDEEEELAELSLSSFRVVIVGNSPLRRPILEALQSSAAASEPSTRVVFVNETGDRGEALSEFSTARVGHLVGDSSSGEALFSTLHKLVAGEFFGLNKYMMYGAEPRSWTLTTVDDKEDVLDGIRDLANDIRRHPRVTDLLITAVDEMILNALTHTRSCGTPIVVEAGSDGRVLGVAVLDSHGMLSAEDVYHSLSRVPDLQASGLPPDAKRAGLGFWIMLNSLSQLAINIEPGRRTEIIGIIDLRKSLREMRRDTPTVGMFTQPADRD